MPPDYLQFRGVDDIQDALLSEKLEANLVSFFNWGMLEAGAFFNVPLNLSGVYGGDWSRLRLSSRNGYTVGQVWESARKYWVWETGVERYSPVNVSGVYVDTVFQPSTGAGTYAHTIDYDNGSIVFETAIPTGSIVQCEYSFRWYPFVNSQSMNDIRQAIQKRAFRVDDDDFLQFGSGEWDTHPSKRLQLPVVVIDAVPLSRPQEGVELGNLKTWTHQDVTFHVLTAIDHDYKKLHDVITLQSGKTIFGYDVGQARYDGALLNFDGSVGTGTKMYPDLVAPTDEGGYRWEKVRFERVTSPGLAMQSPVFYCPIRATMETKTP